jgi:UDP-N-acetylmuramoylalanine--D-glutamate ligase
MKIEVYNLKQLLEDCSMKHVIKEITTSKLESFKRDTEHSMEILDTIEGITFINDSKAINAKLTAENINSIDAELVLILGGDDMKTDYSWFQFNNYYNIKTVVYFGRRLPEIKNIFNKHVMVIVIDGLENAVTVARNRAITNQVVLFSPACPSYDAFDNYKNRGNKFKQLVTKLK